MITSFKLFENSNDIEEISKYDFFNIIADYLKKKINELEFNKDEKDKIKIICKKLKKSCDNFSLTFFPKQILIDFTYTHSEVRDMIRIYKTHDFYYIQNQLANDDEKYYKIKNIDVLLEYIENIEFLFTTKKYNL